MMQALNNKPTSPFPRREEKSKIERTNPYLDGIDEWLQTWKARCDKERQKRLAKKGKASAVCLLSFELLGISTF